MRSEERVNKAAPALGLSGAIAVCATVHLVVLAGGFGAAIALASRWWPVAAVAVGGIAAAALAALSWRRRARRAQEPQEPSRT